MDTMVPGAFILLRLILPLACALSCGGAGNAATLVDRGTVYFIENVHVLDGGRTIGAGETIGQHMRESRQARGIVQFGETIAVSAGVPDIVGSGIPSPRFGDAPEPARNTPSFNEPEDAPLPGSANTAPVAPAAPGDGDGRTADKSSLSIELMQDMLPISPDDFSTPQKEVPMTLRQVAGSVLKNNRAIQVAAYKPVQARANIMEAKAVYDPEAFADWVHSRSETPQPVIIAGVPTENRDFRNEVGRAGIRQHLPSGGNLSAYREWNSGVERNPGYDPDRGHGGAFVAELSQPILNGFADAENKAIIAISRLQADMSEEEFRQTMIETMSQAMEAYWAVAQAREEVRINLETLTMARRLLNRELGRKDQGISTLLDVNRAREAAATRAYNLLLAREQYVLAQEKLKYMMNSENAPIGLEVYVDAVESMDMPLMRVNLQMSIDTALANRPEMKNAELALRTSEVRRRYARHSLLPELNVIGSVRRNDKNTSTPTTGSTTLYTGTSWSAGMEFSMPLGNMKARAALRRSDAELAANAEEQKNVREIVITEVRSAVKTMEQMVREIPLNKRAVEAAAKVLEGEWAKFELNQTGNTDLLQAQDLVAVTQRNHVQSQVRYNAAIIQLLAAEGTLLEKMGIQVR